MASSWIKVEVITPDKPEIYQIAEILNIDPDAVLGKLIRVWAWADLQTLDGNAGSVTKSVIDRLTFVTGFADALISVGWMASCHGKLIFPNFDRHNGESSKKRALTNRRVAKHRNNSNANVTQEALPKALPEREEEEDLKNNSLSGAREKSFIPDPDVEEPPAGNWSDYPGKFAMTGHWQPDPDFSRKAAQWGVILNEPYRPEELAEFITYWQAEGKAKHHAQWEMAFARSIHQQRMKTNGGSNGANKHNQTGSPFAGKSRAMQKFLQSVHDNHGPEAVAALVENDRAVRGQMDQEEQRGTVIDVEASNRRIE